MIFVRNVTRVATMLLKLTPEVRYCMMHAQDCAERAKSEPDPKLQRDFLDMESRWLKLARSYQFVDQLTAFTSHNVQKRALLSERLAKLRSRMDEIEGAAGSKAPGNQEGDLINKNPGQKGPGLVSDEG
jgi:hypothetical protein